MRASTLLLVVLASACTDKAPTAPAADSPKDEVIVGVVTGVEEGDFNHCFVKTEGATEPLDLWAGNDQAFVACRAAQGKRVVATFTTSDMFVPNAGASMKVSLLHRLEVVAP